LFQGSNDRLTVYAVRRFLLDLGVLFLIPLFSQQSPALKVFLRLHQTLTKNVLPFFFLRRVHSAKVLVPRPSQTITALLHTLIILLAALYF
jgi:hypothetical protein